MYTVFLVIYLLVAISLVLLIMLQQGQGVDIGGGAYNIQGSLGGWNINTVSHFMTRLIAVLGVLFFVFSLFLGNLSNKCSHKEHSVSHEGSLLQFDRDNKNNIDNND